MKTIYVGVITKRDILNAPKGHIPFAPGCGAHKNRKRDKKVRRQEGKKACLMS